MSPPPTEASEEVVKTLDTPFALYVAGPVALRVARALAATPVRPNHVTLASFGMLLAAAGALAAAPGGARWAVVILIQASFVLDMVDGQLARLQGTASPLGHFLDKVTDRMGEAILYLAMAAASPWPHAWPLAAAAIAVLLGRAHAVLAFEKAFELDEAARRRLDVRGALTRNLERWGVPEADQRRGWVAVVKGILWFGIGERFVLASLAILAGAEVVYFWVVLLVMGPSWAARLAQSVGRAR